MGSVNQRPWDFGIIYAASAKAGILPTYVDAKLVTQSYIPMPITYTEMTTVQSGGVDTSKPFAGASSGLTLSCEFGFRFSTKYKIKLQCKRVEETTWKDLQIALQADPGTVAAEQTIASTGAGTVASLVFQTASVFSTQQMRIVALAVTDETPSVDDYILIRAEVF